MNTLFTLAALVTPFIIVATVLRTTDVRHQRYVQQLYPISTHIKPVKMRPLTAQELADREFDYPERTQ
jgi:hypothetical protein